MKIIACNSTKSLADKISKHIDVPLADASVRTFNDREIFVEINENIRGEDVFIIQSTSHPANDHLMELLITIDAAEGFSKGLLLLFRIMDTQDKMKDWA